MRIESPPMWRRASHTAIARARRGRVRQRSRGRSKAGCRTSAPPPRLGAVPEVWIISSGRVEVVARASAPGRGRRRRRRAARPAARPPRRRQRLPEELAAAPPAAARTRTGAGRSAPRRPIRRHACSARAKSAPRRAARSRRGSPGTTPRPFELGGTASRIRVQPLIGDGARGRHQRRMLRSRIGGASEPSVDEHGAQASPRPQKRSTFTQQYRPESARPRSGTSPGGAA